MKSKTQTEDTASTTENKKFVASLAADGPSDQECVRRTQEGDPSGYDLLVKRYMERIYAVTYQMTSNHENANDLAQESFIKGYKYIHKFKGDSSFYTWIYRVAVNHTINFLKRRRPHYEASLNDIDSGIENDPEFIDATKGDAPTRRVDLNELQGALNEAVQKLSEPHRMVVTLHDIEGLSHGEIASILKCSEGTVRSRLFYARQQLQKLLKDWL
ncbi:MAG: sigma-70 family RNA polymerase sigma factor [Verrucomicrobiae bacterium]|nr:sigma-70 family RNA polymerase sigma factor [Verrucomicrobiae bacterium]